MKNFTVRAARNAAEREVRYFATSKEVDLDDDTRGTFEWLVYRGFLAGVKHAEASARRQASFPVEGEVT